jgi:hypothetical protein
MPLFAALRVLGDISGEKIDTFSRGTSGEPKFEDEDGTTGVTVALADIR